MSDLTIQPNWTTSLARYYMGSAGFSPAEIDAALAQVQALDQQIDIHDGNRFTKAVNVTRAPGNAITVAAPDGPSATSGGVLASERLRGHEYLQQIAAGDQSISTNSDRSKREIKGATTLIQQALLDLGYPLPKWGADGAYGNESKAAVMAFQRKEGLTVNGIVDSATLARLDARIRELDKVQAPPRRPSLTDKAKTEVKGFVLDEYTDFVEDLYLSGGFSIVEGGLQAEVVEKKDDEAVFRTTFTVKAGGDRPFDLGGIDTKLEANAEYQVTIEVPHTYSSANPGGELKDIAAQEFENIKARLRSAVDVLELKDADEVRAAIDERAIRAGMSIGFTMKVDGGATVDDGNFELGGGRETEYTVRHEFVAGDEPNVAASINTTVGQRRADEAGVSGSVNLSDWTPGVSGKISAVSNVTVSARATKDNELDATMLVGDDKPPVVIEPWVFNDRDTDVTRRFQTDSTINGGVRVAIPIDVVSGVGVSGGVSRKARERNDVLLQDVSAADGERLAGLWAKRDVGSLEALFTDDHLEPGARFSTVFARTRGRNAGIRFTEGWGNNYIGARAVVSYLRTSTEKNQDSLKVSVGQDQRAHAVIERFSSDAFCRELAAEIGVAIPSSLKNEIQNVVEEYMVGGDLDGLAGKAVDALGDTLGNTAFKAIKKAAKKAKASMSFQRSGDYWGRETVEFNLNLARREHRDALTAMADDSRSWAERLEPALALGTFDVARLREGEKETLDYAFNLAVLEAGLTQTRMREGDTVKVQGTGGREVTIKAETGEFSKVRNTLTDTDLSVAMYGLTANRFSTSLGLVTYHADELNLSRAELDGMRAVGRVLGARVDKLNIDNDEIFNSGQVDIVAAFGDGAARQILSASPRDAATVSHDVACALAGVERGPVTREQTVAAYGISESIVVKMENEVFSLAVHNSPSRVRRKLWSNLSSAEKQELVPDATRRAQIDSDRADGWWAVRRNAAATRFDDEMKKIVPDELVLDAIQPVILNEIVRISNNVSSSDYEKDKLQKYERAYNRHYDVDWEDHQWIQTRATQAGKLMDGLTQTRLQLAAIEARNQALHDHAAEMLRSLGRSEATIAEILTDLPFDAVPSDPETWGPVQRQLLSMENVTEDTLAEAAAHLSNPDTLMPAALKGAAAQLLADKGVRDEEIRRIIEQVPDNAREDNPATWGIDARTRRDYNITERDLQEARVRLSDVRSLLTDGATHLDEVKLKNLVDIVLGLAEHNSQANTFLSEDKDRDALHFYATLAALAPGEVEAFIRVDSEDVDYVASTNGFFDPKARDPRASRDAQINRMIRLARASRPPQ